ncbi:hypothetical protein NEOLI_006026 (mitochondrion) [Neolecta irregularis DAH-3]|uniref:Uncharacterized protein n=1 Tax=Neolecta irregularis (strain DAH-3) TaxID=1198029 RepID=A0A1U7LG21_NEOID|nr:hypothetical protein NEOLI_006026 [Neolecta irregularis DAH-3]|eukprot:OLL21604.1 hypothetical protein NEOLI_006026 (mitochondrion) [Neolecta irregularis DAH-3]
MRGKYTGEKNPFYGKTHPDETKLRMRAAKLGLPLTQAHKEKLKAITTFNKEYNVRTKGMPVIVINVLSKEITHYPSLREAGKALTIDKKTISKYIKNQKVYLQLYLFKIGHQ